MGGSLRCLSGRKPVFVSWISTLNTLGTMLQHLIVIAIFSVCLYWVVRRIVRLVLRARKGDSRCDTCTETSCPLREVSSKAKKCE